MTALVLKGLVTPLLSRDGQRMINRPSAIQSILNRRALDPGDNSPLRRGFRNALKFYYAVVGFISCLFQSRYPATITWFITLSVVDTINRVLGGWAQPHIRQERLEAIRPLLADGNAPPAIVTERTIVLVQAAPFDASPDAIFGRLGLSVGGRGDRHLFIAPTPATQRKPAHKIWPVDDLLSATVARAQPVTALEIGVNRPSPEPSARQIDRFCWHGGSPGLSDAQCNYTTMRGRLQ